MKFLLAVLLLLFCTAVYADDKIPALEDVPSILTDAAKTKLNQEKKALESKLEKFQTAGNAVNAKPAASQTDEEFNALEAQQLSYIAAATAFNKSLFEARAARVLDRMIAAVKNAQWSAAEKGRAEKALNTVDEDGDAATSVGIRQIWKDIQARRGNDAFAREASQGKGPGLPGAGNQTVHEDCAVFALANAAGVPYGFAAARAAEFIGNGEWRPADERANPQLTIEKHGLMGGEVILVAEALGKVEIVPSGEFVNTLQAGRPVMACLVPYNGSISSGHEVVLTKTFQHDGGTWFELIDSNEAGAQQRLYLNEKELGMLLKENGVSFRPDDNRTPELQRKANAE